MVGGLALMLVWVGVGVTVQTARARAPQADGVVAQAKQVTALPADDAVRAERLRALVERVQRLSLDDRLDPDLVAAIESAVAQMTPTEQRSFVRDLLPPGLEPMARAFQVMDEDQKRQVLSRLRQEFKHAGWLPADTDRDTFNELVETTTQAFLNTDDPEEQLDLLPTMQRMLRVMQTR